MTDIQPALTPALEAYLVGLIYRNTRTSCVSLSALCGHVSHDSLNRLLRSDLPWSRRLWEDFSSAMVTEGGYLLLDDTTWRRWAAHSEAVSWVWSSSAAHIVRGMQVVLLVWTDGDIKVPVGMRLWQKGGRSKVALAAEMLCEARGRGLKPNYVLFDSWYASATLEPARQLRLAVCGAAEVEPPARRDSGAGAVAAPVRARVRAAAQSCARGASRQRRAALLRDQRHAAHVARGEGGVPHAAAGRGDVPPLEAGVRLGRVERAEGGSAGRPPASRADGAVHRRARSDERRADDLCLQAQLISPAHPRASTATRCL